MTICKIIVWNKNLQKRCPEQQFPKIWPERPPTRKKLARTTIYKKSCTERQFTKKSRPERKFAEKVSRTPICKKLDRTIICEKQVVKNNSLQNLQKMTCHSYLLKLCNIYQVDKCKIRIL